MELATAKSAAVAAAAEPVAAEISEEEADVGAEYERSIRSIPSLQLLAKLALDAARDQHKIRLDSLIAAEQRAEGVRLRQAAEAEISLIRSRLARELAASKEAHAVKAEQARSEVNHALQEAIETMLPSLEAAEEGWVACAGGESCAERNGLQLFRPEERELGGREGCNEEGCTMHKRFCDECCEYPTWPSSMYLRTDQEEGLALCNWCGQFLCPECCKAHEPACKAEHSNRCGFSEFQEYVGEEHQHDDDVGQAEGHCGQPATRTCHHGGEDSDESCRVMVCDSCVWSCPGYHWSGRDEEEECEVRLCKRHAPTPANPCKKPRYGQRPASPAQSTDGELFCGECDGELPGGCPEQFQQDNMERQVLFAQSSLRHAQRMRDHSLFM